MKKTLLLSVVASTMIMAGGDIAPVEPVVEAPAVVSGWDFSGNAVVYYQTNDVAGDLFDQVTSGADVGLQLRATNNDVVAGIGAGIELNGLATLGLENDVVSYPMQAVGNDGLHGGWISQFYLTAATGNTSIKAGRQELPKALSPFAFSENWNVFANTFDAVLVVNTDLPNTTLVGAWVRNGNYNAVASQMDDYNKLNGTDGVWMLTAQNKSIENLTLTGSFYYAADMAVTDDVTIFWADAQFAAGDFNVALQGGVVNNVFVDDMTAFGAKVDTAVSGINLAAAYSHVADGMPFQVGGTTSALYTSTVANQLVGGLLEMNSDKFVVSAGMEALGGNISGAYAYTDSDMTDTTNEFDLVYSTNVTDAFALTAAYVYLDNDNFDDAHNVVRVVGNYKF